MDALELLLTRSSYNKLTTPAPSGEQLDNILDAGLRAPDHANLSPFRFIVCQNEGLEKLSTIYKKAAESVGSEQAVVDKAASLPFRAPMVIVAICQYQQHEKVPRVEQIATTACAVQNMQMAAFAQGFNGIWRTGTYAHCQHVRAQLELDEQDEILGYLYLGTPEITTPIKKKKNREKFIEHWD